MNKLQTSHRTKVLTKFFSVAANFLTYKKEKRRNMVCTAQEPSESTCDSGKETDCLIFKIEVQACLRSKAKKGPRAYEINRVVAREEKN